MSENFIEGMACVGGCIGGAGCLTHGEKNKAQVDIYGRQGEIHSTEFSDEFNKLCIPFEESLTEAQLTTFHKILDCVSDTAAAEMRAAYKVGFKNGVKLMKKVQK